MITAALNEIKRISEESLNGFKQNPFSPFKICLYICCVVYVFAGTAANLPQFILTQTSEPYTLLTAQFIHTSFSHFIFNMLSASLLLHIDNKHKLLILPAVITGICIFWLTAFLLPIKGLVGFSTILSFFIGVLSGSQKNTYTRYTILSLHFLTNLNIVSIFVHLLPFFPGFVFGIFLREK